MESLRCLFTGKIDRSEAPSSYVRKVTDDDQRFGFVSYLILSTFLWEIVKQSLQSICQNHSHSDSHKHNNNKTRFVCAVSFEWPLDGFGENSAIMH